MLTAFMEVVERVRLNALVGSSGVEREKISWLVPGGS
jgi:hypothetical protein